MKRIACRRLEASQLKVEVPRSFALSMNYEGADANDIGSGVHAAKRVHHESTPKALSLLRHVNAQAGQKNHRDGVPTGALSDPRGGILLGDRSGGESVVGDDT
jgi:hypothetical protein